MLLAAVFLPAAALPARARSPLVAELRLWSVRYHEQPQKIDEIKAALEKAVQGDPQLNILLALSQACFIYGDVRAKSQEEKLEAYDRGVSLGPAWPGPVQSWHRGLIRPLRRR
jgi:hypothetical protein